MTDKVKLLKIKSCIKDILWMARRYADGRQTYAPSMFNDAYDVLREILGDDIDTPTALNEKNEFMYDVSLVQSDVHPYAYYGRDMSSESNKNLVSRPFYGKRHKKPAISSG